MPLMTLALILANLLAYSLELASGGRAACEQFGLIPAHFVPGALVTSTFLHDPGALAHIAGNMVCLAIFGAIVERALGHVGFLALYTLSGIAGGLLHVAVGPTATEPLVGASGAIFGLIAVAGVLRPRLMGFVAAFVLINVWHALAGGEESVSFGAHLGGFFAGFIVVLMLKAVDSDVLEVA